MDAKIVLPQTADMTDVVAGGLVLLTEAIAEKSPDDVAHGILGGEFGYGGTYENDVFEMRPFYWGDCACGWEDDLVEEHEDWCPVALPNFKHKATGFEVRWYKWIGRDMEHGPVPDSFADIIRECIDSVMPRMRHASDCAVHNAPAYEPGPCDCGAIGEPNP